MGDTALYVLAVALSGLIGVVGVLIGTLTAVRMIHRDEERYAEVRKLCERIVSDHQMLRGEWTTTLENLDQLNSAVETKRKRAAATLSSIEQKERLAEGEPQAPMSARDERDAARMRLRRIS